MKILFSLLSPQKKLLEQARELEALRAEVKTLTQQNQSMKTGMRRCVSCDYRLDYKQKQQENIITTTIPSD